VKPVQGEGNGQGIKWYAKIQQQDHIKRAQNEGGLEPSGGTEHIDPGANVAKRSVLQERPEFDERWVFGPIGETS